MSWVWGGEGRGGEGRGGEGGRGITEKVHATVCTPAHQCTHLHSRDGLAGTIGWSVTGRLELLHRINCLLVCCHLLLLLPQVGTKLRQTLGGDKALVLAAGGGSRPSLTFPMTSLTLGVIGFPFWCLAVGGHCPLHSLNSSTAWRGGGAAVGDWMLVCFPSLCTHLEVEQGLQASDIVLCEGELLVVDGAAHLHHAGPALQELQSHVCRVHSTSSKDGEARQGSANG